MLEQFHSTSDLVVKQLQFAQENAERNLSASIERTSETAVVALRIVSCARPVSFEVIPEQ